MPNVIIRTVLNLCVGRSASMACRLMWLRKLSASPRGPRSNNRSSGRKGQLQPSSRRPRRMRRPTWFHDLKQAGPRPPCSTDAMDLGPSKIVIILQAWAFKPPKPRPGESCDISRNTSVCDPRPANRPTAHPHAKRWQKGCHARLPEGESRPTPCICSVVQSTGCIS